MTRRNALFLIPVLLVVVCFTATCLTPLTFRDGRLGGLYVPLGLPTATYLSCMGLLIFVSYITNGPSRWAREKGKNTSESLGWQRMYILLAAPGFLDLYLSYSLKFRAEIRHHIAHVGLDYALFCFLPVAVGLLYALPVLGMFPFGHKARHVLNDELSRLHRASALRTGFVITLLGLLSAYTAALFRPDIAFYTLPMIIVAGVSVASLHFAWSEWRADG